MRAKVRVGNSCALGVQAARRPLLLLYQCVHDAALQQVQGSMQSFAKIKPGSRHAHHHQHCAAAEPLAQALTAVPACAEGWQSWPEGSITTETYFVAVVTGFIQLKWAGYYKCAHLWRAWTLKLVEH